uniref:CCT-theta n=1 Tax=Hemiselmis andersenii TaxID=464988 RepID=A0A6T8JWW1_HEMAN|mmetsp:Transcript_3698/g.8452  ORF Transcript_3698/g.8452 Transcript_3698/m.8452 type:complete len:538 (-) Transcript_3698:84-1697(-)
MTQFLKSSGGVGLSDLLKDGSKHFSGVDEAVCKNIEACKKLSDITRTSIGPNGMNKIVVNHLGRQFVTSDAATIVREMEVVHPAAKLVALAAKTQEEEIGDATNLVVVFAGVLLENAEGLLRQGLPQADIISGFTTAAKAVDKEMEKMEVQRVKDLTNVDEVTKALHSCIAAKQYGLEDFLAPLVAKACVQILPKDPANFSVDNVRVAKIPGMTVGESFLMKGFVLTRDAEGTIKHVKGAKVVVFGTEVDLSATETKGNVLIKNADELMNYSKSEEESMGKIVKEIADTGVNVLVAQTTISEMAMHFLERNGIMVVKCPSKFELARLCKLTGATSLARFGAPLPEEMGAADAVSVDEIGGIKCCTFNRESQEQTRIATIVLRSSTSSSLEDLQRAVENGVNNFKQLTKDPRLVSGAGCTELRLAAFVKDLAEKTPGLEQYAIKKYAETLEVIPQTLAENAGQDTTSTVSDLYAAHAAGNVTHGVNIEEPGTVDVQQRGIMDHLVAKREALSCAATVAVTVLRVDTIIMSKQAGGPQQ